MIREQEVVVHFSRTDSVPAGHPLYVVKEKKTYSPIVERLIWVLDQIRDQKFERENVFVLVYPRTEDGVQEASQLQRELNTRHGHILSIKGPPESTEFMLYDHAVKSHSGPRAISEIFATGHVEARISERREPVIEIPEMDEGK